MHLNDKQLTVAICTHNRGQLLKPLIDKLLLQRQKSYFDILLVDNSTNEEDKIVVDEISKISEVSVIYSSPPSLSIARNIAYENCNTEVVAYIDDDAMPFDGWSESICAPFQDKEVGFVAGPIIPIWPKGGRPDWVPEQFIGCLTVLNLGAADKKLEDYEHAYGANMAFRVSALKEASGFNTSLGGAGGNTLLSNEEVEVQDKLRKRNFIGFYANKASVHYLVEPERLIRHWFLSRMAWHGVSTALQDIQLDQHALLYELKKAAEKCGLNNLPALLLNKSESEAFGDVLELVRAVFTYLLRAKSMSDLSSDSFRQLEANDGLEINSRSSESQKSYE